MEATVVLVMLLAFLVGGMMLALAMGYRSVEASRAEQARTRRAEAAQVAQAFAGPGFFARASDRGASPPAIVFDDALLARLEKHVRAEQALVMQFVHFPSLDSLYSKSGSPLHIH